MVRRKKTKKPDLYNYKCTVIRVIDGDTLDAMIELGFDVKVKKRIRLVGVDTWESRTRNLEEKKKGLLAKEFTKDFLKGGVFTVRSHGLGKFGRLLGSVFVDKKCLNDELIKEGHGYSYFGGKKKVFK